VILPLLFLPAVALTLVKRDLTVALDVISEVSITDINLLAGVIGLNFLIAILHSLPKAQKGSGAARWGSKRSPLFVGGGQVFGPSNRNYNQKINKKQKVLALRYAINAQAEKGAVFVTDSVKVESGKTKDAQAIISKLDQRDVLVVVDTFDEKTYLAFRNIKNCYVIEKSELNAYLVAAYHSILIEKAVVDSLV
jgi:large subunit ribosomal protein L4